MKEACLNWKSPAAIANGNARARQRCHKRGAGFLTSGPSGCIPRIVGDDYGSGALASWQTWQDKDVHRCPQVLINLLTIISRLFLQSAAGAKARDTVDGCAERR